MVGASRKDHVNRIGKTLLIFGIVGTIRVKDASVVAALNFPRNLRAVGIAIVQQQLPRPQPARIEIGEIASRSSVGRGIRLLIGHQHFLHVEPHAPGEEQRQH